MSKSVKDREITIVRNGVHFCIFLSGMDAKQLEYKSSNTLSSRVIDDAPPLQYYGSACSRLGVGAGSPLSLTAPWLGMLAKRGKPGKHRASMVVLYCTRHLMHSPFPYDALRPSEELEPKGPGLSGYSVIQMLRDWKEQGS